MQDDNTADYKTLVGAKIVSVEMKSVKWNYNTPLTVITLDNGKVIYAMDGEYGEDALVIADEFNP